MTGRGQDRPQSRRTRTVALATEVAALALVVVAEAAWISVVAGLLQEFALREPVVGIPGLVGFVVAGIVAARLLGERLGGRWLVAGFGLVLAGGALGWLSSAAARATLADGLAPALAANPGGWLAGLAVLRGFAHARLPLAEDTIANLLGLGVPGLAFAATVGGVIGEPHRTRFLGDSLNAAIVYIGATVLALAFARLDGIGRDSGFDWRRNPPWLLLTLVLLVGAIVLAIPLAGIGGWVISVLISVSLGPLLILGLVSGFDRTALRILAACAGFVAVVFILVNVFGMTAETLPPAPGGPPELTRPPNTEQVVSIGIGGLLLLALIVAIILAIAFWMRRSPPYEGAIDEIRTIDSSGEEVHPRRRRRLFGRRPDPATAVEAYVALMDDLDRHPPARRGTAETPAAHAARIRSLGEHALALDLLAADYALARFGGVVLSAREDRRAVGRWRSLRKHLVAWAGRPGRRPGSATAPDADLPLDLEPRRTF
jgi:hypothetical protein